MKWLALWLLVVAEIGFAQTVPGAPTVRPRLVVLDFEQAGDLGDDAMAAARRQRMARTTAELKRRLAEAGLFEVVDDAAARDLIDRAKATQYLNRCNGCELDIARAVGADAVMVPWVFRMSQLVLTMHIEIKDARSGRLLMKRALDFRNDVDDSWLREVAYLVRDMQAGKLWNGPGG
jgi:hypothetical protein